jgi:hypothetical protein
MRVLFFIILILPLGYAVLTVGPVFFPPTGYQDECSFGAVSNAQYRELLDQARILAARDRSELVAAMAGRDSSRFGAILDAEFEQLANGIQTTEGLIASAHAVLRANHSQYTHTEPRAAAPFAEARERARRRAKDRGEHTYNSLVAFKYRLNVGAFGDYKFVQRWAVTSAGFRSRYDIVDDQDVEAGKTASITALLPSYIIGIAGPSDLARGCPPVPESPKTIPDHE